MPVFEDCRRRLDELGFYQPLVPECLPLVEALLHQLTTRNHDLKVASDHVQRLKREAKARHDGEFESFLF